ncbi:HAD family hydrolase [Streptomyces sp. NPDC020983]|uniref:HAD family hydrolase n=1 Tax=Streptomyces sp. NPDC020983 TaxID=3365106 RepID=UPI0037AC51B6
MTTHGAAGPARPFDAVLCDLDNVIRFFDTSALAALERAAGLPAGTTAAVAFAPEVDGPLLLGRITKAQWAAAIAAGLTDRVSAAQAAELAAAMTRAPFRADPAVVALLRRIRHHMPLVLVTNADLSLEADLRTLGLADLPHHVVSSARVGVAKPSPGIYEIAADRAGVPPHRCLFVDDREENVTAAAALGMIGLHYRTLADLERVLSAVLDA